MTGTPSVTTRELTAEDVERENQRQDEIDAGVGVEDNLDGGNGSIDDTSIEDARQRKEENEPALRMSPSDAAREAISSRFKRDGTIPFDGDFTKPENLYGDVAREQLEPDPDADEPGVTAAERQQAAPAEKTFTIKVRGKDVVLTEAQLLERASKVEAGDSYLAETRDLLEQAKELRKGQAEHAGRDDQRHPVDRQSSTQDDVSEADDGQQPRRPGMKDLVEQIQYGSPEEAAKLLEDAISNAADTAADKRQLKRLMNNDLSRSQKSLQDFQAANPEIAGDENSAALMEKNIYAIFREDIEKLGVVDADKIPTDKKTLADWHRFYRVHGQPVSDIPVVLEEAKQRLVSWRGPAAAQQQKPAARKDAAPRVEVNVDRTQRREAIPNQPTRSTAPRPNPTASSKSQKGSDVVREMRAARGQLV